MHLKINAPLVITLASLAAFLPFIDKPLFVDDHAIFEQARALVHQPTIPYRMESGMLGWEKGRDVGEDNPPVLFYGLAATIKFFGDEPWKSRVATIPLQILGFLAFYAIARRYVRHALWATLLLLVTPHLWVTSNSLLVDSILGPVMWIGLYAWMRLWETGKPSWGIAASLFIAMAPLVKYTGFLIWGVAVLWVLLEHRQWRSWRWLWLLIPSFIFCAWLIYSQHLYGTDHFSAVAGTRMTFPKITNLFTVLAFVCATTPCLWLIIPAISCRPGWFLGLWVVMGILGLTVALGWTCARFYVIISAPLVLLSVKTLEESKPKWVDAHFFRYGVLGLLTAFGALVMHADWTRARIEKEAALWANQWIIENQWKGNAYYPGATRTGLSAYLDNRSWKAATPQQMLEAGELLLVAQRGLPRHFLPAPKDVQLLSAKEFHTWNPVRLVDTPSRVGWYGSVWGPYPIAFSNQVLEIYSLLRVER